VSDEPILPWVEVRRLMLHAYALGVQDVERGAVERGQLYRLDDLRMQEALAGLERPNPPEFRRVYTHECANGHETRVFAQIVACPECAVKRAERAERAVEELRGRMRGIARDIQHDVGAV